MYGSGIIFVSMLDTKSQLLGIITGIFISYAGFYHEIAVNNSKRTLVTLFNVYDGTRIKWIPLEYTLDSLIKNPATNKIIMRPFIGDTSKFYGLMIEAPRYRIDADPANIYRSLMLEIAGIKSSLESTTAYYIINKALCSLSEEKFSHEALNMGIIASAHVGKEFIIDNSPSSKNDNDDNNDIMVRQAIENINEHCRDDIIIILSTFLQLMEENAEFRSKCHNLSLKLRNNKISSDVPVLCTRGDNLSNLIYSYDLIEKSSTSRHSNESAPEAIREIFVQLSNITRQSSTACVVIDVAKMIDTFNEAYPNSKISPPDNGSHGAIITAGPANNKYTTIKLDNSTYKIPLKGASLTAFNEMQLREILIQLDSLHQTDKHINTLKKEIIVEISRRNKLKKM
jgi:hypothetical protein